MIEDDEGHARLIEKNIRRAGVNNEIVPFQNGTDALAFLFGADGSGEASSRRQLLILLDLNLPDMAGVDILEKVKANPHTRRSPVIVLTTTDDSREIQRCYDLGANVYITKPVDYDGFANAIRFQKPNDALDGDAVMPNRIIKALYVDDDAALGRLVQRILGRRGYQVDHVTTAEAGLVRLVEGGIDVVILDHDLGTTSGLAVLEDLRAREQAPPVVYVTAST
eukprot:gene33763-43335_t